MTLFYQHLTRTSIAACFQQYIGTNNVSLDKGCRAGNRAINVAFGCQMHHRIRLVLCKNTRHGIAVADIGMFKMIAIALRNVGQRFKFPA
jgi:hypothetical protein